MEIRKYIEFLKIIEKLKCNTRHSWTSTGRQESVAEHSYRCAVMAMLCADEFPGLDMNKVIKMCLIHDFGEAVTGDIPAFLKTDDHEKTEDKAIESLCDMIPEAGLLPLFEEMREMKTPEAKLCKAIDNLEAVISHNEADLSTWTPLEYELNLTYGEKNCEFSEWTKALRAELRKDSIEKIEQAKP
ncbi:MAG: HD domain-containing protein [Clostridia bacterium]|nr:HD domain-containing protein [Clostridia bacterium]